MHYKGRVASISYPDIRVKHKIMFRKDGVNLFDLGNSIFVNTLRNALDNFISCHSVSPTFHWCLSWVSIVIVKAICIVFSFWARFASFCHVLCCASGTFDMAQLVPLITWVAKLPPQFLICNGWVMRLSPKTHLA